MGWGWSGLSSCHQSAVPHTDALLPHPAGLLEPGAQCSGLWGHPACLVLLGPGDNNTYLTGKVWGFMTSRVRAPGVGPWP